MGTWEKDDKWNIDKKTQQEQNCHLNNLKYSKPFRPNTSSILSDKTES